MHTELTINHGDKTFTIIYDGVIRIIQRRSTVTITLKEDYSLRCINKYWYELNASTTPFVHIYTGDIVEHLFVSEV